MCGLTGVVFGKKSRSCSEYEEIRKIFTSLFILSEQRGHHASGVATLDVSGRTNLYKIPLPPTRMSTLLGYEKVLDTVTDRTTLLIGHSRWKTVGSEFNNNNNQPIIAGTILGTHNGTIYNATQLFSKYQFKRFAEVDSEILFRMANASIQEGVINTNTYKTYLSECEGNLSCVFASKTAPTDIFLFKGNKPLFLYYNPRLYVIAYSSSDAYLKEALEGHEGWVSLKMESNRMYQTCFTDFRNVVSDSFSFQESQPKPKPKPVIPKINQSLLFSDF